MKKMTQYCVLVLALLALSCNQAKLDTVNEITDLYTAPAGAVAMSALSGAESTWATDRRYFDLSFGSALTTTLVGYDAFLAPGQYVLGGDEIGKAVLSKTKVNGASAKEGYILVNNNKGKYSFVAVIDGNVLTWEGSLPFVADPNPVGLSVVQSASANKDNKLVTVQLATEGISQTLDENWQTVWTGEGYYLAADLYSEDGYLHDGVYKASAEGGVVNPGEFGIGYDTTVDWGWGPMEMKDWGTCLWTVADGKATAEKITSGIINVASREENVDGKDMTIWTISWGSEYPVEVVFDGAIPALTKPKTPVGPVQLDYAYTIGELRDCSTQAGDVVSGVKNYPLTIVDAAGEEVAYLEFVLTEGSEDIVEGEYVSTEYAHEAGTLANGYFMDFGEWGTFAGGSYYISDGEKVYIDPGVTVIVTQVGTGAFRFTSTGFDFAAAGPSYVPDGEDVGDALPAVDEISEQAAGVDKHSITIGEGDNVVAYFELLTATGDDFVGSFVSTEYASEPGMLCNGWSFPDWGIGGGSFVMKGGEKEYVEPGVVVEVTKVSGSVYKLVGPDYEFVFNVAGK